MKKTVKKNVTTLDEILDTKYGKKGSENREKWNSNLNRSGLGFCLRKRVSKWA